MLGVGVLVGVVVGVVVGVTSNSSYKFNVCPTTLPDNTKPL